MNSLTLAPRRHARGVLRLPGSKSISNRALLLAALADGTTDLDGVLDSDDTRVMLEALSKLGVGCERLPDGGWRIRGCAGRIPVPEADLYLGNAGTAFRPLTAVLALAGGRYRLHGTPRMHERPIADLVDALRALGADIEYEGNEGYPPLRIGPGSIALPKEIAVRGDVSSQFLTGLLIALPMSHATTTLRVEGPLISRPYVEMTRALLGRFGVEIDATGDRYAIPAGSAYRSPGRFRVEGDASSASYFLAAGAIGSGPVRVEGVGRDSVQGDVAFVEALAAMGAVVDMGEDWIEARSGAEGLRAIDFDAIAIPDAAMTLAVVALRASGTTTLRNIGSWRVKETDRIAAMATELRKLGAEVEEGADSVRIRPPAELRPGARIDTYDDHRMAMCFSLVSLMGVPVTINDPGCVAKTFPDYFDAFQGIAKDAG
jgi:3-phosphoshikimate 1-carboxyvinyltransferase